MKIQPIINPTTKTNLYHNSFKGLWGEKKFLYSDSYGDVTCDYYQIKYFPFLEESKREIRKAILDKQSEFNKAEQNILDEDSLKNTFFCENTLVRKGKKLNITQLECEELASTLDKEMPKTISELVNLKKLAIKYSHSIK